MIAAIMTKTVILSLFLKETECKNKNKTQQFNDLHTISTCTCPKDWKFEFIFPPEG